MLFEVLLCLCGLWGGAGGLRELEGLIYLDQRVNLYRTKHHVLLWKQDTLLHDTIGSGLTKLLLGHRALEVNQLANQLMKHIQLEEEDQRVEVIKYEF
jgi:hypothetical protein